MPPGAPEPLSEDDPLVGAKLGGYVVVELIGAGGMGRVYRAHQVALDREVALKVLPAEFATDATHIARFRREAKAAAAVQNGHLVQVHDVGEKDGLHYYVMELIDGESFGELLENNPRFKEGDCLEIARQALLGLEAAHKAGIAHRDVKPDNLMLDHNGKIKVADLGLARSFHEGTDTRLTQTGAAMGTPRYVSPEQICDSAHIDFRTDFYSLAATVFHFATGQPPFPARTSAEVMSRHLNDPVPRARDVNPKLSEGFTRLLQKMMAKRPEERPQTHAEIYQSIDRCLKAAAATAAVPVSDEPWSPRSRKAVAPPKPARAPKSPAWLVAGGIAALAIGVGLFLLTRPPKPDDTKTSKGSSRSAAKAPAVVEKKEPAPAPAVVEKKEPAPAPVVVEKKEPAPAPVVEERRDPAPLPSVAGGEDPPNGVRVIPAPGTSSARGEAGAEGSLASIPGFIKSIESYLEDHGEQVGDLAAQYLRALEGRQQAANKAGDSKLETAFAEEGKRVKELTANLAEQPADAIAAAMEEVALPPLPDGTPDALVTLRETWVKELGTRREKPGGDLMRSLHTLADELAAAGEEENAKAVRAWREAFGKPECEIYRQWPFDAAEAKRRQDETAKVLGVPVEQDIDLGNGVKMTLVLIPAGEFLMGSPETPTPEELLRLYGGKAEYYRAERPQHGVRLSRPFWLGKYEVTREQWQALTGNRPSALRGPRFPVEHVSWNDCETFLAKLRERLPGRHFRLPTSAEWEYACRCGAPTEFFFGGEQERLGDHAWFDGNSGGAAHSVGAKEPNSWGLHDMHGNVWEWAADWDGRYTAEVKTDPPGPANGSERAIRGGWYKSPVSGCRSACRGQRAPESPREGIGFRVVEPLNP